MLNTKSEGYPVAPADLRAIWADRLDRFCAGAGALVPVGLVIGNIGFESLIGVVGLGWLLRLALARENPLLKLSGHSLVIPWVVWFLCMLAGMLVEGPGSKGWAHDVVFVRYVLFGLALLEISQRLPVARYLLYGLAAGIVWAGLNTVSAYLLGADLLGKPLIRYTGKLKEAARISGLSAYAAAFFVSWGLLDDRLSGRRKAILLLIGIIAFTQVLQTHVRTAMLAAAAGIFFAAAFYVKRKKSPGLALAMVLPVIAGVGAMFYLSDMVNLDSTWYRIYYWRVAWRMWLDHPVFGVGISSFQDAYKEMAASGVIAAYVSPSGVVFSEPEQTHAHSLLLMLVSSTGLLGLLAFSWLFVRAVLLIFKKLQGPRFGLISWPVVLFFIGLTGFNIYHSWYQALLAYWLVLIGAADRPRERTAAD